MASKYSCSGVFVIVPVKSGAVVTQRDQSRLGSLVTWKGVKFSTAHFLGSARGKVLDRIVNAKVSKPMKVYEITERQWEQRNVKPETIPGTGLAATKAQMAKAFVIGEEKGVK